MAEDRRTAAESASSASVAATTTGTPVSPAPAARAARSTSTAAPSSAPTAGPAVDDTRYIEIWNLVFMQYLLADVKSKTEFTIVSELPKKNIDTGMGMERVAFLKQGVDNMYEIDQVRPVLDVASALSRRAYGADHDDDVRMRVIADHVRSSLMLMTDGVTPGNEGRGYILRRLLRRVVRAMRLLGVDGDELRRAVRGVAGRDARRLPGRRGAVGAHLASRARRGGGLHRHPRQRHDDPRHRGREDEEGRRHDAARRHHVPAARHVRLPDRPDARDRRRGGPDRRPRRVRRR